MNIQTGGGMGPGGYSPSNSWLHGCLCYTYSLAQPDVFAHFAHEQNTMHALRMRNKSTYRLGPSSVSGMCSL